MANPRPDKVVGILRSYLYDLDRSSKDIRQYVHDRNYCVDCYCESDECQCSDSEKTDEEEEEKESCQAEEEDDESMEEEEDEKA